MLFFRSHFYTRFAAGLKDQLSLDRVVQKKTEHLLRHDL
jgi:hypothetical protein